MITGSWCLLPVLSHNQKKEGVHSHFSDEKMEAYEGDAHGFKDTADPRQPLTCQDRKSRPWEGGAFACEGLCCQPMGGLRGGRRRAVKGMGEGRQLSLTTSCR